MATKARELMTHQVLKPIRGERPYRRGDMVNPFLWHNRATLEKHGYISPVLAGREAFAANVANADKALRDFDAEESATRKESEALARQRSDLRARLQELEAAIRERNVVAAELAAAERRLGVLKHTLTDIIPRRRDEVKAMKSQAERQLQQVTA